MLSFPLPSSLLSSGLSPDVQTIRERLKTASEEAVTGRYSDLTNHLSGKIGQAMLGQKALDDIGEQRVRLTLLQGRLDVTQNALATVQESTNGIAARMQSALGSGDNVSRAAAANDATAALETTFSALNTRLGNRYIFAGNAISSMPLASTETLLADIRQLAATATDAADFENALDTYFDTPGGGWRQNVYSGTESSSDPLAKSGTDPALLKVIRGLAVVSLSTPNQGLPLLSSNTSAAFQASSTLLTGQTELTELRANVGLSQSQISRNLEALDIEEAVMSSTFNSLTARDQYEAATELRELERNLEASYLLTSRLSNLSLLNYLR